MLTCSPPSDCRTLLSECLERTGKKNNGEVPQRVSLCVKRVNTGACMRMQWASHFSVSSSILSACLANLHGRL